jgi:hypothetical protein
MFFLLTDDGRMHYIAIRHVSEERQNDYHHSMPLDPISAAIVGSLIGSAVESALTPAAPQPVTGMVRNLPVEAKRGVMSAPVNGQVHHACSL